MVCCKIFSSYTISSFGLSGRGYWKKEGVKYGKINSGQNGQRKRRFWDPGLTEKDTTKNTNNDKKQKGKHMCWGHSPKAGKMEQRWMRTRFGPEYSSDDAGDGPMGKTVGKKNKEKAKRMQSKESWHEMAAKRQASLPKAPVREVDEWTQFIELMAGCRREEISMVMWEYASERIEPSRSLIFGICSSLISGALIALARMSQGLKKTMIEVERKETEAEVKETEVAGAEPREAEPKETV